MMCPTESPAASIICCIFFTVAACSGVRVNVGEDIFTEANCFAKLVVGVTGGVRPAALLGVVPRGRVLAAPLPRVLPRPLPRMRGAGDGELGC